MLKGVKNKCNYFTKIMFKTYTLFQYYNNNYIPVYHEEIYLLYFSKVDTIILESYRFMEFKDHQGKNYMSNCLVFLGHLD